ncbi:cytochrome P450 [Daldinia caldariorum]|uniref:cytochrome P450 n=1 Tax=Daldinia caldariorum TaxID=326644 RepID=UPI00200724A4|nr:cytochrome P450 [Daldinia caldariorum]KAI1464444.1 cytochrome P450 [Daldinia caldariorum]
MGLNMPYHKTACTAFALTSCLVFARLVDHLMQPRDLTWWLSLGILGIIQILCCMLLYRLAFHPLAKYPGTLFAACTDLWSVYWIIKGSRHLELHRQHQKTFVRHGPNRISVNSATASRALHHVNANASLSDTYGSFKFFFGTEMSMTTLDDPLHMSRRKINATALTPTAVKNLSRRITPHVDTLIDILKSGLKFPNVAKGECNEWGPSHDMEVLLKYCIADIMADTTFSHHWNAQGDPTYRHFIHGFPQGVAGIHLTGHIPWIFRFNLHKVFFRELLEGVTKLKAASDLFADNRASRDPDDGKGADIWSTLQKAQDPITGRGYLHEELRSESGLLIIAGTDGLITATTSTLFYLLHNPSSLARLTREVRDTFPLHTAKGLAITFAGPELRGMSYLYACIDEAMRLSPPVPSILPRCAHRGGIVVEGEFFPEGTNIGIPHYSLHRNETYFPRPLSYEPERWMPKQSTKASEQEKTEDDDTAAKDAGNQLRAGAGLTISYTPFGAGRYNCVGKYLAYQEMAYILARLVWLFDMRVEPGNTLGEGTGTGEWGRFKKEEYQLYDGFVSEQEGPVVQFRYRKDLTAAT